MALVGGDENQGLPQIFLITLIVHIYVQYDNLIHV